jgi:hypothetical protein
MPVRGNRARRGRRLGGQGTNAGGGGRPGGPGGGARRGARAAGGGRLKHLGVLSRPLPACITCDIAAEA